MIPLSVPNLAGNEWKYIKECLDTNWVSSVGSYVDRFELLLAEFTGAQYAVATSSGTTALHLSLLLAGVQPGDRVLVPNLTFVASANAVRHAGAEPIFVDVDAGTWQMDLDLVENYLGSEQNRARVSAIMPVHVLGNMVDMKRLLALAARYELPVIEDATESLGTTLGGSAAGTFGLVGCLSFNGNKIITTGGGGMILTNDQSLAQRAKHLSTQAKADPIEFYHDEVGYNYRLVNVLAAMGVAQMEQLPGFLARKAEISAFYKQEQTSASWRRLAM
jgi:perosamine synthetase